MIFSPFVPFIFAGILCSANATDNDKNYLRIYVCVYLVAHCIHMYICIKHRVWSTKSGFWLLLIYL